MPDAHKNFAYSTVATAPSLADSGSSLVVQSGDGTKFSTPPFNVTVWPIGDQPLTTNAEILRVTAISGDNMTITRIQEGTAARSILVGDQIAATITAKTLTDVEWAHVMDAMLKAFDNNVDPVDTLINMGSYRVFMFYSSHNANGWKMLTNAKYTASTGMQLIVLGYGGGLLGDITYRQARFRNITDLVDIVPPNHFNALNNYVVGLAAPIFLSEWTGDLTIPSKMLSVPAGKTVEVEIWNGDTNKRALGAWVICRGCGMKRVIGKT